MLPSSHGKLLKVFIRIFKQGSERSKEEKKKKKKRGKKKRQRKWLKNDLIPFDPFYVIRCHEMILWDSYSCSPPLIVNL